MTFQYEWKFHGLISLAIMNIWLLELVLALILFRFLNVIHHSFYLWFWTVYAVKSAIMNLFFSWNHLRLNWNGQRWKEGRKMIVVSFEFYEPIQYIYAQIVFSTFISGYNIHAVAGQAKKSAVSSCRMSIEYSSMVNVMFCIIMLVYKKLLGKNIFTRTFESSLMKHYSWRGKDSVVDFDKSSDIKKKPETSMLVEIIEEFKFHTSAWKQANTFYSHIEWRKNNKTRISYIFSPQILQPWLRPPNTINSSKYSTDHCDC